MSIARKTRKKSMYSKVVFRHFSTFGLIWAKPNLVKKRLNVLINRPKSSYLEVPVKTPKKSTYAKAKNRQNTGFRTISQLLLSKSPKIGVPEKI